MEVQAITNIITEQDKEFGLSFLKGRLKMAEKNIEIGLRQFRQPVNTEQDLFELKWAIDILEGTDVFVQIPEDTYPIRVLKQQRYINAEKMLGSKAAEKNQKVKQLAQASYDQYTNVINWLIA